MLLHQLREAVKCTGAAVGKVEDFAPRFRPNDGPQYALAKILDVGEIEAVASVAVDG